MEDPDLFQPFLIPRTTTTTSSSSATTTSSSSSASLDDTEAEHIKLCSSNSSIILRLLLIISIGIISVWANYEASKGFGITLVNDAKDSPEGKRFTLLYISNDKATRIVQNTSFFVEKLLYPDTNDAKKQVIINHVTVKLASNSLPNLVTVDITEKKNDFVISLSPSILMEHNKNQLDHAITSFLLQGMARVWLWNSEFRAPKWILDGMVEYINELAGFGPARNFGGESIEDLQFHAFCFGEKNPKVVARFLDYCERREKGFVQRFNKALRDDHDDQYWIDRMVEDVVGISVKDLCDSFKDTSHGLSSW